MAAQYDEEIEKRIQELTQQEYDRFSQQNQLEMEQHLQEFEQIQQDFDQRMLDFEQRMDQFKEKYDLKYPKIEDEFGLSMGEPIPEGTVLNNKFRGNKAKITPKDNVVVAPKTKTQKRTERIASAKNKLKNKSGKDLAKGSKKVIKARNIKGQKFKVKPKVEGANFKQIVASTLVNAATESVEKEVFRLHPDTFADLDNFADLTDDDIKYFADNMFDPSDSGELKNQKIKEWRSKRAEAQNNRLKASQQNIKDNPDDYLNSFIDDYSNRSYGNYSGEQTIGGYKYEDNPYRAKEDLKNPESYNRRRTDFEVDENGNVKINKSNNMDTIEIEQNKKRPILGAADDAGDDIFGWMKKHKIGLGEAINVLSTVSSYKDARKKGHSVASSAARAAGSFVMGEMLGFWGSMGWELAKGIPKAAIKGAEVLYKENRKMNAAANQYGLGGDFQDTQQLATMRQSGMEMAKMAQYNLQQTLMGNEATHLHR